VGAPLLVLAAVKATVEPRTPYPERCGGCGGDTGLQAPLPQRQRVAAGATAGPPLPPFTLQRQQGRQQGRQHTPLCRRRLQRLRRLPPRLHAWVTPCTPPHAPPSLCPTAGAGTEAPVRRDGQGCLLSSRSVCDRLGCQLWCHNGVCVFFKHLTNNPPRRPRHMQPVAVASSW
jgi:hypothetical protein